MIKLKAIKIKKLFKLKKRTMASLLAAALVFNLFSMSFWVRPASAASIDTASDTMTRHKITTDSNHTIEFDTPTGVHTSGKTITVTFEAGFDLSTVVIGDVDFEVDGTGKVLDSSAAAGVWGYSKSGQEMEFTSPTDAAANEIAANATITVRVGATSWDISTIDSADDVGVWTSISAVDSNTVYISHGDSTNNDLKVAKTTNGGTSWTNSTVDSPANGVGNYSSIAAANASDVFISYHDASSDNLKVARTTNGGTSWSATTEDSGTSVGRYTSISAYDDQTVFISYLDNLNAYLKVAKTTDGGDNWTTSNADTTDAVGPYTSIYALTDQKVFISYYDDTNDDLKFAKTTDGGTIWTPSTVDSGGLDQVGLDTSISAYDDQTIFISYWDQTNGDLKVAKTINGGTSWTTSAIDTASIVGRNTSIAVIDANTVFISYFKNSGSDLKIARTTNGGTSWALSTVDSAGNVGLYTSIAAIDSNSVYISYQDNGTADLKFARTSDANFVGTNQIENPGPSVGSYEITIGGNFGDSGEIDVPIMDDDQVTISASVDTYITFDLDTPAGSGGSHSETAASYSVDLQELTFSSVTDEDTTSVTEIYLDLATNADDGATVDVLSTNGATGLSSASSGDAIPSATATLAADTTNGGYGLAADEEASATEGTLTEVSPFNVFAVTGGVGGLTTSFQTIFNTGTAPIVAGDGVVAVRAVAGKSTSAADDYTDTLTFRATGTY